MSSEPELDPIVSDEEGDTEGATSPTETVEFGWQDDKPVSGRRKAQEKQKRKIKPGSFETMGFIPDVLKGIKRKGYQLPTPIQRKAIPLILGGQDVVGMARTGSGKTAAFVVPMLQTLQQHSARAGARAVILSPTRELALQTAKVVKELGRYLNLRMAILVGGDSMEAQFAELAANPDIIIATPGRLMHHLQEIEGMSLRAVEYCVFDEADRLFEMGFAEQIRAVLAKLGDARQTLLFSATLPSALAEFARAGLKDPEFVRLDADSKLSPDLALAFFTARKEDKVAALIWLLREVVREGEPTIVFTSTRHHVEFLFTVLQAAGVSAACVYGAMDQAARKIHTGKFRAGKASVLVTTDVAARGLDIPLLDNVINYDFPAKPKLFVHRAGRVARAGRRGSALSLVTREELPYLLDLHLFLSRPLFPAPLASVGEAAAAADELDPSTSTYGSFPQAALEDAVAEAQQLVAENELQGLQKSVGNAWSLYVKTRPPASPESVARARDLPKEGIHPLLARSLPTAGIAGLEAQTSLKDISQKLKQYRPSATVLEAEVAPTRRGEGAGGLAGPGLTASSGPGDFNEVMRLKRRTHDATIKATKSQREHERAVSHLEAGSLEPGSGDGLEAQRQAAIEAAVTGDGVGASCRFRDAGFFIADAQPGNRRFEEEGFSVKGGAASQWDGAVMDLLADDQEGMAQQSRQFHWDKRKRQYIQLQPGEKVKAGKRLKTESGASVAAKKGPSGLYKKWSKAHQTRIAPVGQMEDEKAGDGSGLADRFQNGGRGWKNPMKSKNLEGRGAKEELKAPAQVRKARKLKERRGARGQGSMSSGRVEKGGHSKGERFATKQRGGPKRPKGGKEGKTPGKGIQRKGKVMPKKGKSRR